MEMEKYFFDAAKKGKLHQLLRGEKPYEVPPPADVLETGLNINRILDELVYKSYKKKRKVKAEFENALLEMLDETDYDVYVVIRYILACLWEQDDGRAPFELSLSKILERLQDEMLLRTNRMKTGIDFPDGSHYDLAWDNIEILRKEANQLGVHLF